MKQKKRSKKYTLKRQRKEGNNNVIKPYISKILPDIIISIIYPNNRIISGLNRNDYLFRKPTFLLQIETNFDSKSLIIYNEDNDLCYINTMFYIAPNIYFSRNKVIGNSGYFSSMTNILFYVFLSNVILFDGNILKLNDNTYTTEKNDIIMNTGTFEPVVSGDVFNILDSWRKNEILKMEGKYYLIRKGVNVTKSIFDICTVM